MAEEQLPSIVDVARLAGVSIATASRVLSSSSYPVSESTRQKVLKAAATLNYVPNSLARSLKARQSKLIAVLVGDNADPYFAEVVRGVEEVANTFGYLTFVCNTDRDPQKELFYLQTLQDYRVDGIIFAGGGMDDPAYTEPLDEIVQRMRKRGTEVITLSQHLIQTPAILTNNVHSASSMTSYLVSLGHQRIAFVAGPDKLLVSAARLQGYRAALAEAGIAENSAYILPGDFTQSGGERAIQLMLQLPAPQRPTAIFCCNDETAFGVMSALHSQGLDIPHDISVCGFGDLPMARVIIPALTTVRIGLRDLGRRGAHKLFALLQKQDVTEIEWQETSIVVRETTAAPLKPF